MEFDVEYDLSFKKIIDFNFFCSLNPFRMGHRWYDMTNYVYYL